VSSIIEIPAAPADLAWEPARVITIESSADYLAVAERRKAIRSFIAKVETFFAPLKKKASEAHKALCESERQHLTPAKADLDNHDRALRTWDAEQERMRQEERRRLEEQARREEEVRRLAEAAAMEREAQASGDVALRAEAEALISEPIEAPVIVLPKATPTVEGLSYREVWQFEVVNAALVPDEFKVIDEKKLGSVVRAMKGATKIPGVRVFSTRTVVTR
jgi:hypothetical protein